MDNPVDDDSIFSSGMIPRKKKQSLLAYLTRRKFSIAPEYVPTTMMPVLPPFAAIPLSREMETPLESGIGCWKWEKVEGNDALPDERTHLLTTSLSKIVRMRLLRGLVLFVLMAAGALLGYFANKITSDKNTAHFKTQFDSSAILMVMIMIYSHI
jgi:hypothetical protein